MCIARAAYNQHCVEIFTQKFTKTQISTPFTEDDKIKSYSTIWYGTYYLSANIQTDQTRSKSTNQKIWRQDRPSVMKFLIIQPLQLVIVGVQETRERNSAECEYSVKNTEILWWIVDEVRNYVRWTTSRLSSEFLLTKYSTFCLLHCFLGKRRAEYI